MKISEQLKNPWCFTVTEQGDSIYLIANKNVVIAERDLSQESEGDKRAIRRTFKNIVRGMEMLGNYGEYNTGQKHPALRIAEGCRF